MEGWKNGCMDGWICGMMDGRMDRCMDRGGRNGSEEYMNKSMPQEHIFQLFLIRTFIKCVWSEYL